jgi:hypothetical protein
MKRVALSAVIACVLVIVAPLYAQETHDTTNSKEGMIRGSVGIGMGAPGGSYLVVFPINMPWMDTGIDVGAGDILTIVAVPAKNHPPCDGRADCPPFREPDAVMADGALGNGLTSLVGRIGSTGGSFSIGEKYNGPVPDAGRLYIGYNDCWACWGDNTGSFEVTIGATSK